MKEIGERIVNLVMDGFATAAFGCWFYFGVMGWVSWRQHTPVKPSWELAGVFIVGAFFLRFLDIRRQDDEWYDQDEEKDGEADHERTSV